MSDEQVHPGGTEDVCRPVRLGIGEYVIARGAVEMTPEDARHFEQIVETARALQPPPDEGAPELYERLHAAREARAPTWHEAAALISVLMRVRQGRMPEPDDLAAIEAWPTEQENR